MLNNRLLMGLVIVVGFAGGAVLARYYAAPGGGHARPVSQPDRPQNIVAQPSLDTYYCPMHADVMTHEPGNCPVCGMRLVKMRPAAATMENIAVVAQLDERRRNPGGDRGRHGRHEYFRNGGGV